MRGNLETIVGAMFAGKTSELLKRILWAKHQNKRIVVIKPSIDDRYSNKKIITHNDLSHECYAMKNWKTVLHDFSFNKDKVDVVFLDEIQFMNTHDTLENVEKILNEGIDVIDEVLDVLLLKFNTGLYRSDKSNSISPLDSVVFKIPSLSISKSILSRIPSKSKSGGHSETVISLDSKY